MCRVRFLGSIPSVPAIRSLSLLAADRAALGFASFGLLGHQLVQAPGSIVGIRPMDRPHPPGSTHRPPPFRFRWLSALELRHDACRPCRDPDGPTDQGRLRLSPALQRFRRPMPGSSGRGATRAGRTSRMRFFTC
jgi:hypothetical protein